MNKLSILASLGLTILASSALTNPALASDISNKISDSAKTNFDSRQNLVSQLRGHDIYDDVSQTSFDQYMIGRVIAKSGNILFVKLADGTYFQAGGTVPSGCDVLVEMVDGRYEVAGVAHSGWISHLISDYGWKEVTASGNLNDRTAAIWASFGSSSATVSIPPRTTSAPSYTPVQNPVNPSIRGLW